jgi:hypothetical protein
MFEGIELDPGDRVLFLTIPDTGFLYECAALLTSGIAVAIGPREEVYHARAIAASLDNVMIAPATADDIPWQDGFFSWIIDTRGGWPLDSLAARELFRVLAPSGRAWLTNLDVAPLVNLGLRDAARPGYNLLTKPGESRPARPNGLFKVL